MPVHFPHNDCMIEAVLKEGCVHSDLKEFCAQQLRKISATYLSMNDSESSSGMTNVNALFVHRIFMQASLHILQIFTHSNEN